VNSGLSLLVRGSLRTRPTPSVNCIELGGPLFLQSRTHLDSLPVVFGCSRTDIFLPVSGVAQFASPLSLRPVTQTRSSLLLFGKARLRMTLLVLNSSTLEPFSSFKGLARMDLTAFVVGVMNSVSTPPLGSLAQLGLPPLTCGTSCLGSLSSVSDSATFEAPPSLRGASGSEFSPPAEACTNFGLFLLLHSSSHSIFLAFTLSGARLGPLPFALGSTHLEASTAPRSSCRVEAVLLVSGHSHAESPLSSRGSAWSMLPVPIPGCSHSDCTLASRGCAQLGALMPVLSEPRLGVSSPLCGFAYIDAS